ncbi:MAG: DMT family transporter [Hasllibacter sp.]
MPTVPILSFVLACFAANSLLTRAGVAGGAADPMTFALVRAATAAAALAAISLALGRGLPLLRRRRALEAGALTLYLIGFSLAYLRMDAGTGALILFGTVQVVMFAAALSERPGRRRWAGTAIALAGLALLADGATDAAGFALMAAGGVGWAVFSLAGRRAADPLAATAANFVWTVPALLALTVLRPAQIDGAGFDGGAFALAAASGVVASGLGYAAWYAVLPRLERSAAALAQLAVPAIALVAAWPLLGEVPGPLQTAACALILGGIAFGLPSRRRAA